MQVRDILTKKPFYRLQNSGLFTKSQQPVDSMSFQEKKQVGMAMTQTDFLEEYYPSAHKINSELFFPEHYNYGEVIMENGEKMETMYREETFRVAVPLQNVIAAQHLVHLYGNDTHHELADRQVDAALNSDFFDFQYGWLTHNIDVTLYQAGRAMEITGDKAIVFYTYEGRLHTKVLSFLDGDTLYPHYDSVTGKMSVFARKFSAYDEKNDEVTTFVEVWDDANLSRYKRDRQGANAVISNIKDFFGLEGYELIDRVPHGFPKCPVVYKRHPQNGPGWNNVQYIIDDIEVALSYWAKACASTANDAYILQGDNVEIKGDPYGRVRAFTAGTDDKISLLEKKTNGEYFQAYVERLYKELFRGAFTVEPPQLKSGDTPAAAIKLIYSPNLDLAILQAKDEQDFINDVRELFCIGYGMERGEARRFINLNEHILSYIIPFVHENTQELVQNLVALKSAGLMSTETGAEHNPYTTNGEADKIFREQKQQQAADRLYQLKTGSIN